MTSLRQRRSEARKQLREQTSRKLPQVEDYDEATLQKRQFELEILDFYMSTCADSSVNIDILGKTIQKVKGFLYDRDYEAAFGTPERLNAYVYRWSPSRSFCYAHVFYKTLNNSNNKDKDKSSVTTTTSKNSKKSSSARPVNTSEKETKDNNNNAINTTPNKVLSIGGGACGEIVGYGHYLKRLQEEQRQEQDNSPTNLHDNEEKDPAQQQQQQESSFQIDVIDMANWTSIIDKVKTSLSTTNSWGIDSSPQISFIHKSILSMDPEEIKTLVQSHNVITIFFTLNELFQQDKQQTIKLLQLIRTFAKSGTTVIFIESAGSYSDIQVGKKTFSIQMLVHYLMTSPPPSDDPPTWNVIEKTESVWYRHSLTNDDLEDFGFKLENMRYFISSYYKN